MITKEELKKIGCKEEQNGAWGKYVLPLLGTKGELVVEYNDYALDKKFLVFIVTEQRNIIIPYVENIIEFTILYKFLTGIKL